MLTLAIDSSQDVCTLALGNETKLLAEYHFEHKMSLLRRLVPNIEQMLVDSGCSTHDLDAIVVSLGPGSFTGLRVGVTTAKALAYALKKPIVGVPTMDAIARGVAPVATEFICPMVFARSGEVYWSLYDSRGDVRLEDYQVSTLAHAMEILENHGTTLTFCGTGATRNAQAIHHRFGIKAVISKPWADFARGAALIEIGMHKLQDGRTDNVFTLAPMYIKKPTPVVRLETGEFEKA
ncbi:MAG: tRNA (adenosine(37)-N6)-threonylcarbamoyltransferase complex dimerization subunit type 1 TsaB [Armatimonadota bacterium]|nr:tRNA (adenosine(37)-N6)-threonylcarbamoyltransferase complex dimerization subunit type 1 TsaB [bacterium]